MTMHLVGPYMTTTKYNSKKKPSNSKKLLAAQTAHAAWLKKRGIDDASLEKRAPRNKNGRREGLHDIPDYQSTKETIPLSNKIAGHGPAKESMTYSGERRLLGIATMHKSNMVPVFADNKQAAIDIARMRR
jgi:hypothetical protein